MKLINYKCINCGYEAEALYQDTEKIRELFLCAECGNKMEKFNFKNNKQQWKFMDKKGKETK